MRRDLLTTHSGPVLLGCEDHEADESENGGPTEILQPPADWKSLPAHKDEDQVQLDVNRAFVYYPKGNARLCPRTNRVADAHELDMNSTQLDLRRKELREIIVRTLRQHPMLCYFQGYHDIVQVMMLVLGPKKAYPAVEHLSVLRIRDFMLPSLAPSLVHLQLLPAILYTADRELYTHLSGIRTHFALAAALTMYAHEIEEYAQIARLFDFLLAHEAAISIYLFASIILLHREELLEIPPDEPDMLTWKLTKIPGKLDIEAAIASCITLYKSSPPDRLPFRAWRGVSSYSVLKTTRKSDGEAAGLNTSLNLEQGEAIFVRQTQQLARQEQRQRLLKLAWRHRRPIGGITLAVMAGMLSIWLQRQGLGGLSPLLWPFWNGFDRTPRGS